MTKGKRDDDPSRGTPPLDHLAALRSEEVRARAFPGLELPLGAVPSPTWPPFQRPEGRLSLHVDGVVAGLIQARQRYDGAAKRAGRPPVMLGRSVPSYAGVNDPYCPYYEARCAVFEAGNVVCLTDWFNALRSERSGGFTGTMAALQEAATALRRVTLPRYGNLYPFPHITTLARRPAAITMDRYIEFREGLDRARQTVEGLLGIIEIAGELDRPPAQEKTFVAMEFTATLHKWWLDLTGAPGSSNATADHDFLSFVQAVYRDLGGEAVPKARWRTAVMTMRDHLDEAERKDTATRDKIRNNPISEAAGTDTSPQASIETEPTQPPDASKPD